MSNHDFLMPYDASFAKWLTNRNYPAPPIQAGNRTPEREDIFKAIERSGQFEIEDSDHDEFFVLRQNNTHPGKYEIRIDCRSSENVAMHGNFDTELVLAKLLAKDCGQLVIYPDTGDPAVIVDRQSNVDRIYASWSQAVKQYDSWDYFYRQASHINGHSE